MKGLSSAVNKSQSNSAIKMNGFKSFVVVIEKYLFVMVCQLLCFLLSRISNKVDVLSDVLSSFFSV